MLLADDIGLGKTTVALSILARDKARGSKRSTLILCPAGLESTTWKASPDVFLRDPPCTLKS
jgi:SNF2 family DNA or RNA helicase